jgi:hypothetical protein
LGQPPTTYFDADSLNTSQNYNSNAIPLTKFENSIIIENPNSYSSFTKKLMFPETNAKVQNASEKP